jgi:hypothetical protein
VSTNAAALSRGQETGAHVSTNAAALPRGQEAGAHVSASAAAVSRREETGAHMSASAAAVSRGRETRTHVGVNPDRGVTVDLPGSAGSRDKLSAAVRREEVKSALLGLGWKPVVARAALAEAAAALDVDATFDQLLREALRRCPKPSVTTAHDG